MGENIQKVDAELHESKSLANDDEDYEQVILSLQEALKVNPTDLQAFEKLTKIYMDLEYYKLALNNITHENFQSFRVKSIFDLSYNMVRCCWGVNRYEDALGYLNNLKNKYNLKDPQLEKLEQEAEKMLKQSRGDYDMEEICRLPLGQRHTVAEYKGPVEEVIKMSGDKGGNGLVATADIIPGQLIICSKAFVILLCDEIKCLEPATNPKFLQEEFNLLCKKLCKRIQLDKNLQYEIWKLSDVSGSFQNQNDTQFRRAMLNKQGRVLASTIKAKLHNNSLNGKFSNRVDNAKIVGYHGLWLLPSYINHTCVDHNAYRMVFGDIMMIRATKLIKKGEEILFSYNPPESLPLPKDFEIIVSSKGPFSCDCRLCKALGSENAKNKREIKNALKEIQTNLNKTDSESLAQQFQRYRKLVSLREKEFNLETASKPCQLFLQQSQSSGYKDYYMLAEVTEQIRSIHVSVGNCISAAKMCNELEYYYARMQNDKMSRKWRDQGVSNLINIFGPGDSSRNKKLLKIITDKSRI